MGSAQNVVPLTHLSGDDGRPHHEQDQFVQDQVEEFDQRFAHRVGNVVDAAFEVNLVIIGPDPGRDAVLLRHVT